MIFVLNSSRAVWRDHFLFVNMASQSLSAERAQIRGLEQRDRPWVGRDVLSVRPIDCIKGLALQSIHFQEPHHMPIRRHQLDNRP